MYRFEYMTQTQIGELFGVSPRKIGKWLAALELRTEKNKPSRLAFDGGFVKQGPSRGDGYNWVWHSVKTVAALEKARHRRIFNPPLGLVDPVLLNGPFRTRENSRNSIDLVNGDGSVAIVVSGHRNAEFLVSLLNLADEKGVIGRHFS